MHIHGAELFSEDEATSIVLQRQLMNTIAPVCVDALLHFLAADMAEEAVEAGGATPPLPEEVVARAMTPTERSAAAREVPNDAKPAVEAAVKALGAAGTATSAIDFISAMETATEAVGLRLKRLDRKSEGPLVQAQLATLKTQAADAGDSPTLLAAAVPFLVAKFKHRCVSLPGRALGPAVEMLREHLEEEQHAALAEFHAAVVDSLKAGGDGGVNAELQGKLETLEPKIRTLIEV